jgi:hypothetical protein
MRTTIIKIEEDILGQLEESIERFDFDMLEKHPESVEELMQYYLLNTDPVYSCMRKAFSISFEAMDNEVRAMLGHFADMDVNDSKDTNLSNAYHHFRRMNIDSFKTICDEFDKFYTDWFRGHYYCDFSHMRANFLCSLAEKYYNAKTLYKKAQKEERVGSDHGKHKILQDYSQAALAYVNMYRLYAQYRKKVKCVKFKFVIKRGIAISVGVVTLISGVLSFF